MELRAMKLCDQSQLANRGQGGDSQPEAVSLMLWATPTTPTRAAEAAQGGEDTLATSASLSPKGETTRMR